MVKKSVAAFMFSMLCGYCVAQQSKTSKKVLEDAAWARAGCGADEARFNIKLDKTQRPNPQPEAGQAIVYVFEDDLTHARFPTTRAGLDGKWTGGNVPGSYLFFSVQPGTHRLCSNWQGNSSVGAAVDFTAEAGKIYYFHATITSYTSIGSEVLALKPVEDAEAQFLIATHYLSVSQLKSDEDEGD